MTRVLISGSRNWTDENTVRKVIYSFPPESVLIVGDARGADEIARNVAQERSDIIILEYKADWNKHGKRAGPIKNIEMFSQDPDEVYTFQIDNSKGTAHAIKLAEERNIKLTKFHMTSEENEKYL